MLGFLKRMLTAVLLSAELILLTDLITAAAGMPLSISRMGLIWILTVAVVFAISWKVTVKGLLKASLLVAAAAALTAAVGYGAWYTFVKTDEYRDVDAGKEGIYGGRNVMVIVPHQDDEINILGGVIEEFVQYGSTVRIVYVTNGDAFGIGPTRLQEALDYGAYVGVPEENIIFLGYGDRWDPVRGMHIYNAEPGEVIPSVFGAERTYGIPEHPAYREGEAYTAENFLSHMESVILEYKPDMIFCSDYDDHIEHKALTLAFDKVMGRILGQQTQYRPLVFKGYAYSSAWYAEPDYYGANILSTKNVFEEPHCNRPAVYQWEKRLRFPVDAGTLDRSLVNSRAYGALAAHDSQEARYFAESVVNGDRVFWHRRTDSECILSEITVSSGNGAYLNDFMLIDNKDLWNQVDPYDSVWIPETGDGERCVRITLPEARDLYSIVLYDHPSEEQNVLNARIAFEDGTQVETGALIVQGAATEIPVQKTDVKSFTLTLLETEGEDAGLTEIEAYTASSQGDFFFGKLMDPEGNFAYDYRMESSDTCLFTLYTAGDAGDGFFARCDNEKILTEMTGKELRITCPSGESGTVSVYDGEGELLEGIFISCPGKMDVLHRNLAQTVEKVAGFRYRQTVVYRLGKLCREILAE